MPGKLGVLPHLPRLCGADSRSSPVMPFYFDFAGENRPCPQVLLLCCHHAMCVWCCHCLSEHP